MRKTCVKPVKTALTQALIQSPPPESIR
jgi:hypothetical protein